MNLIEKLDTISKPKIKNLEKGSATSIEQVWTNLIAKYLPEKESVFEWHEILKEYIDTGSPTFAIRGYNSYPKERYGELRRGFLTKTEEFSYFYTDNFFAAYFYKMAIDGFIPTLTELIEVFKQRLFPSRFGRNTFEEQELLAIKQGKDPGINNAGFKIAHILPVGKEYFYNNQVLGSKEILSKYFPKGERYDWKLKEDLYGAYYVREIEAGEEARRFAVAHFLRFVHPFNYFLCPKKNCEKNDKCLELAEYQPLLNYAHDYMLKTYGEAYIEFLDLSMASSEYYQNRYNNLTSKITINYDIKFNNFNEPCSGDGAQPVTITTKKIKTEDDDIATGNTPTGFVYETIQNWVKRIFTYAFENNVLSEEEIARLHDLQYSKEKFKISHAMLVDSERQTMVSGHARYWKKPIDRYYICSQWWKDFEIDYHVSIIRWLKKVIPNYEDLGLDRRKIIR